MTTQYNDPQTQSQSKNLDPAGAATEDARRDKDMMNDGAAAKLLSGLTGLLLAVLLASACLLHGQLVAKLDFDGELLPTDAEALYGLRCVREGRSPYHDFSRPPHVVALYGPLFYAVPGTVARLLNTSWMGMVVTGRCYTYGAWFGVAALIYALARQAGNARLPAMAGALLWLSGALAPQWAIAYRPDSVAVLCSLAALWVYQRGHGGAAVVLMGAAFLHKQTAVTLPLVVVATEIGRRRFGWAATVAAGWAVCVLAAVIATQRLSDGAFVKNAFGAVGQWAGPEQAWVLLQGAVWQGAVAFAAGALMCGDERLTLLRRCFAVSFALALLSSAKAGAYVNYYLESYAIACVLAAGFLAGGSHKRLRIGWLSLALVMSVNGLWSAARRFPEGWTQPAQEWDRLAACLGELSDRVLVEDAYVAVRQSPSLFALHPRQLETLRQAGKFDDSALLERISAGKLDAIIASFPFAVEGQNRQFPARWLEAARGQYVLEKTCALPARTLFVYRPANR